MNILFLTLLDFHNLEISNIYTDLMNEFVYNGHKVHIISPSEKKEIKHTYLIDKGAYKIVKLKIGKYQKSSSIRKGLTTLSIDRKIKKAIKEHYCGVKIDLLIYSTPPITFTKSIRYVKKKYNATTYLLLKDIFPQNAVDLGIIKKNGLMSLIYYYFRRKEETLYRISDYIGCMSLANKNYIISHNKKLNQNKIEVCPNSILINDKKNWMQSDLVSYRTKYDLPINKTIFLYGGNLGKPQGIEFIADVIRKNEQNQKSFILIVGSGTEYGYLDNFILKNNIKNSKLFPLLNKSDYDKLVNMCDVGLVFLDNRFTIPNFPSRILSYMEASKPIIAATDVHTDLGTVINEGKFGYWCESGDLFTLNKLINKLTDSSLRIKLGNNARNYLEENYSTKITYEIIIKHFQG